MIHDRRYAVAFWSLLLFGSLDVYSKDPDLPKLGSRAPRAAQETGKLIMIHPADLAREFRLSLQGREFFLGVNSKLRVSHIEVRDPQFVTPEGVRVGDPVQKTLNLAGASFQALPGCFAYVLLPSGWAAGFWPLSLDTSKQGAYSAPRNAEDVPNSAVVSFIFRSIYLPRR